MPILPTVCNNINMKNVIKFVKSAKSIDVDTNADLKISLYFLVHIKIIP